MKCRSCGADIPPAFVHAIATNQCAGCGGEIMSEEDKQLLDELSEAMEKMPNDPQGVAGWLMSNYQFRKIGDAEPVEKFHRKGNAQPESNGNASFESFLKRSGSAEKVAETQAKLASLKGGKFANLAQAIKKGGADYGDDEENESEEASMEDIEAMREMLKNGQDPFAGSEKTGGIKGGGALSQEEIMAIQEYSQEKQEVLEEMNMPPNKKAIMLQRLRQNQESQKAISDKSGGGAFWRG